MAAAASSKPLAVIAGVGTGTGSAIARRFAKAYTVVVLARGPSSYSPVVDEINAAGGSAVGISADVTDAQSVKAAFARIPHELGAQQQQQQQQQQLPRPLAASIYNVGGGFVRKPFLDLTPAEFSSGFDSNARGAFNFSQAALPLLLKSAEAGHDLPHPPTLIFTGATAALKGNTQTASFAAGKFALRALSQSLAKEFGPRGVHVSHAVIDGVIDIPSTEHWHVSDKPDAKIRPDAIAEAYWNLHTQHRSAFTWEIDIRPYVEKW